MKAASVPQRRRLPGIAARISRDPVESALLAAFGLVSLWVLALTWVRATVDHQVWTGIDGLHASDPALYFGFIASSAHSVLISDIFDTGSASPTYLHPGFVISGLLTHLGLTTWQAYLLWKPVAVIAFFVSVRAYVHRLLRGVASRRAALVLALLFVPTAAFLVSVTGASSRTTLYLFGIEVDMWPGTWLWGYSFTLLAVAAMPGALLLYERDRRRRRIGALGPILMLLCSWFQPWQGATLIATVAGTEILYGITVRRRPRTADDDTISVAEGVVAPDRLVERAPLLIVNLTAGIAPLAYYAVLERLDPAWRLSGAVNRFGGWPLWAIAATIAPLGIPALRAYLHRPASWQDIALRVWPLAGLAVYWAIALGGVGTFPIHAFQGLTIPLGILAVTGTADLGRAHSRVRVPAGALAIALLVVPALVWKLRDAEQSTKSDVSWSRFGPPQTYYLRPAEANALQFLHDDARPGAVLAAANLGEVTPGRTGRQTWIGIPSYTPGYTSRAADAERLFNGTISAARATAYVRSTHARFVLQDCEHHADMVKLLNVVVTAVNRFGCATVITVRRPPS